MKARLIIFGFFVLMIQINLAQSDSLEIFGKAQLIQTKHKSETQFPSGNMLNHIQDWGGMVVSVHELQDCDYLSPVIKSFKNGWCEVPHWGYLEKGRVKIISLDQSSKVITAGHLFYVPSGHIAIVEEDVRVVDFSPQHQTLALVNEMDKLMEEDKN